MRTARSISMRFPFVCRGATLALALLLSWPRPAAGYAVLAHEAIIDAAWETHLKPELLRRFPQATEEQLSAAQAYAYGGSIIQDLGYYPYGSHFFSNLTHYVRSGEFVQALLRDARDLHEYAFALGALAHFAADNDGHRIGTNRAVPVLYPKLQRKYGDVVTYEADPLAHVKTEFGFDVLEVAHERYAPESYHDFIGFEVARRLLDQAFEETYGLELNTVLFDEDKAMNSYRHAVSKLLPKATRIAWSLKKDEIKDDLPGITKRRFLYNLSRANYEKEWGRAYKKPTAGERFLAFLYRLVPKFGPLRVLQFRTPTPETQQMFEASFNATLERYQRLAARLHEEVPDLPNENFDTGGITGPGQYALADATYADLLDRLAERHFAAMSPELRAELLRFYGEKDAPYTTKRNAKAWAKVQEELAQLRTSAAAGMSAPTEEVAKEQVASRPQ
jgi:zinc dependent phospholipase C